MTLLEFIEVLKDKTKDDYLLHLQRLKESEELIQETIHVLEQKNDSELSKGICEALFVMYTDKIGSESHRVCLQFIPAIIWAYHCQLSKKGRSKPEAILLSFYNQCVHRNMETPLTNSFRFPKITKSSVYHEPFLLSTSSTLTENALNQHDRADQPIFCKGPTKYLDHIPAGMRNTVISTVLQEFNFYLSLYNKPTLVSMCNLVIRLTLSGYSRPEVSYPHIASDELSALSAQSKVRLSAKCVQEFVTALQFISFNGFYDEAKIALDCLHQHSHYSLSYAGTLNTMALKNLLELSTKDNENQYYQVLPPLDPRKCRHRAKGGSTMSPRPLFSSSIDQVLNKSTEESHSNVSLNQSKSVVNPSDIVVQIETTKRPVVAVPSIEISMESSPPLSAGILDSGHVGKRESTLTDEDSEYENDKTPLIHTNIQIDGKSGVTKVSNIDNLGQVVVKIKTTSPQGPGDEETPM